MPITATSARLQGFFSIRRMEPAAGACAVAAPGQRAEVAGATGLGTETTQGMASRDAQNRARIAFLVKWVASTFQILGYAATGFGFAPWNLYLFLVGVFGWFAVGVLWKDRAIMLLHVVALAAMLAGMSSQ